MENNTKNYYSQGSHTFENIAQSKESEKLKENTNRNLYFQNDTKAFANTNTPNENNNYPKEKRRSFTSVFDL